MNMQEATMAYLIVSQYSCRKKRKITKIRCPLSIKVGRTGYVLHVTQYPYSYTTSQFIVMIGFGD
jgi:hypothetical protein